MSYRNHPVPAEMFDTPFALPYLLAFGSYHLHMGHPQAAMNHFRAIGDLQSKWSLESPGLVEWRTEAAASLFAMGRAEQARELIDDQLDRAGDRDNRARGAALRRLAAGRDPAERPAVLAEAVRVLEASGDRLELAYARADLEASRRAQLDDRSPWAGTPAEPRGSDGGVADPDWAELTDAERRVAALAATGTTNRQIADRLSVTVSTVEQHLTKIYRKLNVRRRADLPASLMQTLD
jgi:DNA-binding CsgD family transcriptional regulator